ncbi:hypothetical protein B0H16DRAFT_464680 [Mycena metata]|uniref:BTB domain-containing protein n=1 Tax=Mycena metata TaxID=1033252 RepID=A0AAD7P056_9AGAR|nr:hypothetical protein B0H16DRAFT_464680 [Mycena metata]
MPNCERVIDASVRWRFAGGWDMAEDKEYRLSSRSILQVALAMTSPPAKRQRTEIAITRSEIWYQDGSVVLQAQDTQFRVHWSLLSQNSSFFRDMQSLPQPPEEPTVDGCHLIELPDDAIDVKWVLKALYTPSFLAQTALPFAAVAAHIRLGRKYDFRELLDLAVSRLIYEHPTTLEEYDALVNPYQSTRIIPHRGIELDIVTLARKNDILCVLPCAYYRVLRQATSADSLFKYVKTDDGTQVSLALVDLRRCVSGREKILDVQSKSGYPSGWHRHYVPGPNCTGLERCVETREKYLCAYLDTLTSWRGLKKVKLTNTRFCAVCQQDIVESNAAGRRRMWDELPGMFNIAPSWGELKNEL